MASTDESEFDADAEATTPASEFSVPPLLPWQRAPAAALLAQRAQWHHGTLLYGAAGSGSQRLGLNLAQGMLCQNLDDGLPCGQCTACHLFLTGGHPDFRLLKREFDEKSLRTPEPRLRDEIIVDQVRELIESFLYLTSHRLGAKVVTICLAEEMNTNAANALLKSLEEPPEGTNFLLISHQPRRLPPTVISRCRRVPVPQPTAEQAADWLSAQGAADPTLLLAQAGGAPLKALTMLDEAYQAERTRFLNRLAEPRRLSVIGMGAEVDSGARALKKVRLQAWFDLLVTWSYDLAACAAGAAPRYHPDFAPRLSRLAETVAPLSILRYHRRLLRDRALLSHPLNPRLVAENALFGYRQAVLSE